jgi:uncharacterized low-complexity protein
LYYHINSKTIKGLNMKKITTLLVALLATFSMVNADDELTGQKVFDSKCVACHFEQMPEKMSDLKAPPMSRISAKVKHAFDDNKTQFVAFVADYIQDPSEEKAKCMARAIKNFGIMPAIGKAMSEEERNVVANWMFDNFDEKWETKDCKSGDCKGKGKNKCGEGKCGGDKKAENKCGTGKCGGDKKPAMKCAAGKCGGK